MTGSDNYRPTKRFSGEIEVASPVFSVCFSFEILIYFRCLLLIISLRDQARKSRSLDAAATMPATTSSTTRVFAGTGIRYEQQLCYAGQPSGRSSQERCKN